METLSDLAKKYPTDKEIVHDYYNQVYENILKDIKYDVKKVCEIGIGGVFDWGPFKLRPGHSLRVWRDYFPNAQILGLDNANYPLEDDMTRITIEWLDQSKKHLVVEYAEKLTDYDIIVDDGSHIIYDQTITFYNFFKAMKNGGIYILEDLHTSISLQSDPNWISSGNVTTLDMLETYNKTGKINTNFLSTDEKKYLEENIEYCKIFKLKPEWSYTSIIKKLNKNL